MGMPVKLSDELVTQAKSEASRKGRSTTGQVEHWARIGRDAERKLPKRVIDRISDANVTRVNAHPLVAFFDRLNSFNMKQPVQRKLSYMKFPVYEADPESPEVLVQIQEDGKRTPGHWDFERNCFVPAKRQFKQKLKPRAG